MVNRVFGNRYQVTEKIGMGGMAEVFKATDATLGRTVALKVMLPQYATDQNFAARFRQEAQAAANLNSPYIVNIYDWGKDADSYYIVMEYIRGTDLKTAIQQRGHIHPRKVAEIGSQVCSALSVAHGYDIIHRDIKSANIMVQADGNVKVMDFGIAEAGKPGMTQDSSVLGTAHYVSPEQAQGKTLTPASDLYSLGVVLYEAATGQLPFDGPDVVSVAMKQVSEAPVPPRQVNPDIDPQFEQIIMRALEKDPRRRFSTANEMKRAIDDYLKGNPSVTSAQTQVLYGGMAGAGAAAGQTTVMPATDSTQMMQSGSRELAQQPSKKSKKPILAVVLILLVAAIAAGVAFASGVFGGQATVPSVTGMTVTDAQQSIEDAGFKVGISYDTSTTVEKDHVISQDPEGDTKAAANSTVNIVVSTGETSGELVGVPNLIGLTASQAESSLKSANLVGKSETGNSDDTEAGKIFQQNPDAFSQVPEGTTITYTISLGKKAENKNVPSVIGLSQSDAESKLTGLGFEVSVKEKASDNVDKGEVCDQSPDSGTSSPEGATVTIYVSTGSTTTKIPSVVGMTEGKATSKLTNAGFKVSVSGTGSVVVKQSPTGSAKSGTTITITLGSNDTGGDDGDDSGETTTSAG